MEDFINANKEELKATALGFFIILFIVVIVFAAKHITFIISNVIFAILGATMVAIILVALGMVSLLVGSLFIIVVQKLQKLKFFD